MRASGLLIPAFLHKDVENLALAVDRPPEVHLLTVDRDEDLIEIPTIVRPWTTTAQLPSIGRTEFDSPAAHGFVGNLDAAFGKEIFDIAEAQREPEIEPDGVLDDRNGETVAAIRNFLHPTRLCDEITTPLVANVTLPLVAFALGCSYSFEAALLDAGVPIRHIEQGKKVCTYRTGIDTVPAGRFQGKMVVSMRNFTAANAIRQS